MKDFKKLKVWNSGMDLITDVYKFIDGIPANERYGLRSQITIAAVSIPSNIAEGSSRRSDKEYYRFLELALGSAFELETQLLITKNLGYGDPELLKNVLKQIYEVQKMLSGFMNKLL